MRDPPLVCRADGVGQRNGELEELSPSDPEMESASASVLPSITSIVMNGIPSVLLDGVHRDDVGWFSAATAVPHVRSGRAALVVAATDGASTFSAT